MRHRIASVYDKIHDNLFHLPRIDFDSTISDPQRWTR